MKVDHKIAIIGAGITGLTAAFKLKQQGLACTLFEKSDRAGGVIRTQLENRFLSECGPNSILDTSPKLQELIEELGLKDQRLNASVAAQKRFIVRNGKPIALPGSPPAFFSSPAFSTKAKLRLFAEPFIRSKSNRDESLADFVLRRLGQEFLDYAINPFVSGVYAGDPTKLSTACAFPKLYKLEQEYGSLIRGAILGAKKRKKSKEVSKQNARMFTFKEGMETLPRQLHNELDDRIRLNTPVTELQANPGGTWNICGEIFTQLVLAIPAHSLSHLNAPFDLSSFDEIYYPHVVSLSLGFKRDQIAHPLDGFGMLIPRVEKRFSLGSLFTASIFAGRAPKNHTILTTYIGGATTSEKASLPKEEIIQNTLKDHRDLLGLTGEPCHQSWNDYPKAIPQYNVGYERHLDHMNQLEATHPTLHFAGHYRDGISVADSIMSGIKTAEKIYAQQQ